MSVLIPRNLFQGAITTSPVIVYQVPSLTTAIIQSIDIVNTSPTARSVRVHVVPPGDTEGTENALIYDQTVAPHGNIAYGGPLILEEAWSLVVLGNDTGLTVTVSGLTRY